jgi:hypothetical protein
VLDVGNIVMKETIEIGAAMVEIGEVEWWMAKTSC